MTLRILKLKKGLNKTRQMVSDSSSHIGIKTQTSQGPTVSDIESHIVNCNTFSNKRKTYNSIKINQKKSSQRTHRIAKQRGSSKGWTLSSIIYSPKANQMQKYEFDKNNDQKSNHIKRNSKVFNMTQSLCQPENA